MRSGQILADTTTLVCKQGVLLQRLADSLLHLLSLTASPTARLVHTAEERGGHGGCMAQFRPHVLLLPLAASLAELVMPLNSARTPPLGEGGAAEEDARVVKVLVSSAAFDIEFFRFLANVEGWLAADVANDEEKRRLRDRFGLHGLLGVVEASVLASVISHRVHLAHILPFTSATVLCQAADHVLGPSLLLLPDYCISLVPLSCVTQRQHSLVPLSCALSCVKQRQAALSTHAPFEVFKRLTFVPTHTGSSRTRIGGHSPRVPGSSNVRPDVRCQLIRVHRVHRMRRLVTGLCRREFQNHKADCMHPTMTDPVTLPASGQVLDRRTILRHLSKADKPDDPFSRTPLTADMLIANDTLRDKIQSWLLTQRHGGSSGSD